MDRKLLKQMTKDSLIDMIEELREQNSRLNDKIEEGRRHQLQIDSDIGQLKKEASDATAGAVHYKAQRDVLIGFIENQRADRPVQYHENMAVRTYLDEFLDRMRVDDNPYF